MPPRKLTTIAIPTLAAGEWYDQGVTGLILRVGVKRRTWQFRYHGGGAYHRKPIGHFPAMGLSEARDAARKLLDRADRGIPVEAHAPHPRAASALTLGALLDRYEALRAREGQRSRSLPKAMRLLRHHLRPYLSLPAEQFSKADLRASRDAMVEAGTVIAANRLLGYLGPILRWAAQEDLISVNFVPAIRRAPEQKRERVLTKQEITAIWRACDRLANNYGRLVRFLLLTAQRRGEAASLRHGDIIDGRWKQVENKASRPHSLPLPPLALRLIGQGDARDYAFAGRDGKIGGFAELKRALDKTSGVSDWRLHDLRRTAASSMQDLGIRNEVVQSILNHAVPGVGGVYLRSELEKQKAEALATWAAALTRIVGERRVTA
jgi:integrase